MYCGANSDHRRSSLVGPCRRGRPRPRASQAGHVGHALRRDSSNSVTTTGCRSRLAHQRGEGTPQPPRAPGATVWPATPASSGTVRKLAGVDDQGPPRSSAIRPRRGGADRERRGTEAPPRSKDAAGCTEAVSPSRGSSLRAHARALSRRAVAVADYEVGRGRRWSLAGLPAHVDPRDLDLGNA